MAEPSAPGIVLDTGALLALEAGKLNDVLAEAFASKVPIRLSGGAVAQAWRGGPRSARLGALLKQDVQVVALDAAQGRRVGELVARTTRSKRVRRPDVVDAHTALISRETKSLVYTSDPDDIGRYGISPERIRRV